MAENDTHYFENGHLATKASYESWGGQDSAFNFSSMIGETLLTTSGEVATNEYLAGKKQVALIFAGQWCPWCRAFDPLMTETYQKLKANDPNDTEVVYISVDSDEATFTGYYPSKPWAAVPFNRAQGHGEEPIGFIRKKVRQETGKPMGTLQAKWELGSVPSIVVLDGKTGAVITKEMTRDKGEEASDGIEFTTGAPGSWLSVQED